VNSNASATPLALHDTQFVYEIERSVAMGSYHHLSRDVRNPTYPTFILTYYIEKEKVT